METIRTTDGLRQRALCHLGELNDSAQARWLKTIEVFVSEAHLAALRRRGGQYLVRTPRTKLRAVERALLEGSWTQVRDDVEAQLVSMPGGTETSTARREKELAIRRRFCKRLEDGLERLAHRVATGRLKDRPRIERALARLQARYAMVTDLYEMGVREERGRLQLAWRLIEARRAWRNAREGAYLLRTNLEAQAAEELWTKYIQLIEAEAAFRALKSELASRAAEGGHGLVDHRRPRNPAPSCADAHARTAAALRPVRHHHLGSP